MAGRGQLTDDIKQKMESFLGRETSKTELRLIPYAHYVMTNERKIDPRRINGEEREILSKWRAAGYIEGGAAGMAITKEFFDFCNDILFDAYVAYDN